MRRTDLTSDNLAPPEPNRRSAAAPEPKRRFATLSVERLMGNVLGPAARRRGFAESTILSDWASIVGPTLAGRCQPVRVEFPRGRHVGGTLHLHARGGAALELQHMAPQLAEKVNGFFGFAAVRRIRLVQAAPPASRQQPEQPNLRPLGAEEEQGLRELVGALADQPLGQALLGLGRCIQGTRRR
jgi:hypothetical protein